MKSLVWFISVLLLSGSSVYSFQLKQSQISQDERIAIHIVDRYNKIFTYLTRDSESNRLTAKQWSYAYDEFDWPKASPHFHNLDYAKQIIKTYSSNGGTTLTFVEFCRFMEDIWHQSDAAKEKQCEDEYKSAKAQFEHWFSWWDLDHNGYTTKPELWYGISRVMWKDADETEIENVMRKYQNNNIEGISQEQFLLAAMNGMFDISFGLINSNS